MANYLYRRMNRELKKIKYRAIGSSVLIIVAVMMYVGLAAMVPIAGNALEDKVDELNLSDYLVHVNAGNESQVQELSTIPGVENAEARLLINSRARYTADGDTNEVASFLMGIDPGRQPTINMIELRGDDSRYFTGNGSGTALLEWNFANIAGIGIGDSITVITPTGEHTLEIIGVVLTPEHIFMPVNPQSLLPYPGNLAVLFVPDEWARGVFDFPDDFVNEFQFMFKDGVDQDAMIEAINSKVVQDIIIFSVPKDDVYGYRLIKEDLSQGENFTGLFAMLFLLIAFFIVYTSFARIVQEQRREIGILRALGYSRGRVLGSYLYMALLIGSVSSIIGILIGMPMGQALGKFYVELMIGATMKSFVFMPKAYIIGFLFGPLTAALACLIAVWSTVTMDPQDAIRGTPRSWWKSKRGKAKTQKVRPLGKPKKRPYISHYTYKNMARHPVRTLLTVIAVGGAMCMGSMSLIMWASFENSLYASVDDYESWDVVVEFSFPLNDTMAETVSSPHVIDKEYIARLGGDWQMGDKEGFALIIGMDTDLELHEFNIDEGRLARGPDEVMLNKKAADKAGIEKGDTLSVKGPIGTLDLRVVALVEDYIGTFFVDMEVIDGLAGGRVYAGMYIKTADGMAKAAKSDFLQSPLVSEVQTRGSMTSGLIEMMDSYANMMYVMSLLGVAVAAPTLANMVFVNILERYPEYGQLRAIGYSKGSIGKSIILELMIVVSIGVVIGAPMTYGFIWGFENAFKEFFPMYKTVLYLGDWLGYLGMALLIYIIAFMVAIPSIRHVNKMDVAKTVAGDRFG